MKTCTTPEYTCFSKYPVINDTDFYWGLAVAAAGYRRMYRVETYPPNDQPTEYFFDSTKGRVLGEYQLLTITRGSGSFQSKHVPPTTVKEGDMILLFPGEWHTYRPNERTGWDEYWVGFKGPIIDGLVKSGFFKVTQPIYSIGVNELVITLYNRILEVADEEKTGFQQILGGLVYHLLSLLQYTLKNQQFNDSDIINRINRAKIIMQENIFQPIAPEEIAAQLNLSYSWFRRAFKEYTGFSPAKYISELKLKKAKTMLVSTPKSIKEISIALGFENAEYFSTFFKKMTGQTPMNYRNKVPKA
ncbi:MAG: AraC family transcriptional regulator [Rikenellaceae bacterium]|jgi:AraC-like DNA-binding protein|nr:AraC family transcriptional regulator [Rikenellaceae bacterium]